MDLNQEELNKLRDLTYDGYLDKCLKKKKIDILSNRYGFVRGIPKELADDIFEIRFEKIPENVDKEKLERLKYICEYSLSKMSKSREAKNKKEGHFVFDKFTQYQDALGLVKNRLKEF